MVIYLRHPKHGTKVAVSEVEATDDKRNGWEEYKPTAKIEPEKKPVKKQDSVLAAEI